MPKPWNDKEDNLVLSGILDGVMVVLTMLVVYGLLTLLEILQ